MEKGLKQINKDLPKNKQAYDESDISNAQIIPFDQQFPGILATGDNCSMYKVYHQKNPMLYIILFPKNNTEGIISISIIHDDSMGMGSSSKKSSPEKVEWEMNMDSETEGWVYFYVFFTSSINSG